MINLYKYFFLILLFLNGCQSTKDALSGKKQNNADEFMVEKKNPLVLPPEFEKLPVPGTSNISTPESNKFDLEKVLKKDSIKKDKLPEKKVTSGSIEKSILDKIQKN
tara:strand:+ start:856 stop:1176 length:321 start_codon:yes stop_codon:yes gene_type:complete